MLLSRLYHTSCSEVKLFEAPVERNSRLSLREMRLLCLPTLHSRTDT